jgi:hypothetical protein
MNMSKSELKNRKDNTDVPEWQKKDQHHVDIARRIIRLFDKENVQIGDMDRIFAWVKDLVGTIPVSAALSGFERENEKQKRKGE